MSDLGKLIFIWSSEISAYSSGGQVEVNSEDKHQKPKKKFERYL